MVWCKIISWKLFITSSWNNRSYSKTPASLLEIAASDLCNVTPTNPGCCFYCDEGCMCCVVSACSLCVVERVGFGAGHQVAGPAHTGRCSCRLRWLHCLSKIVQNEPVSAFDPLDRLSHLLRNVLSAVWALVLRCKLQPRLRQEFNCAGPGYLTSVTNPSLFTLDRSSPGKAPSGAGGSPGDVHAWVWTSPCPLLPLVPHGQCLSSGGDGPLVPPPWHDSGRRALRGLPQL